MGAVEGGGEQQVGEQWPAAGVEVVVLQHDVAHEAQRRDGDAWRQLEEVRARTTVAWGTLEVPLFVERCRELVRRIPSARGVELPGVAHLPYLEQPALVADLVAQATAD